MEYIDFLPDRYRERNARRRVKIWQIAVLAIFGSWSSVMAIAQYTQHRRACRELAALDAGYSIAIAHQEKFQVLQTELRQARLAADLGAYLAHPWPRTQILAAIVESLPPEITLSQLRLTREYLNDMPSPRRDTRTSRRAVEDREPATGPPTLRDINRLRQEYDQGQWVASLSGSTFESARLHEYIARLGAAPLLTKAELRSLESSSSDKANGPLQFHLRAIVRPSYGQPGGPTGLNAHGSQEASSHSGPEQTP